MTADLALAAERIRRMQGLLKEDAELLAAQESARHPEWRLPIRPNREELAWAAGFFDGEGTTHVNSKAFERDGVIKGPYLQLYLSVEQVGEWCLFRFKHAVGGLGTIYPVKPWNGHQPKHRWQVSSFEGSQAVLAMLWPFWTSVKRTQAAGCLQAMREYHQTLTRPSTRGHLSVSNPRRTGRRGNPNYPVTIERTAR